MFPLQRATKKCYKTGAILMSTQVPTMKTLLLCSRMQKMLRTMLP